MHEGTSGNPRSTTRNRGSRRGLYAVLALAILGVVLVGGAFSAVVYMLKRTPAYKASEEFVRHSPEIRALVGGEMRFGWVPRGSILADANVGSADLRLKVRGAAGSTRVEVLARSRSNVWTVVSAKYVDHDGSVRTLLPPLGQAGWGGQLEPPPVARHAQEHAANAFALFHKGDFAAAIAEYGQAIEGNPQDPELHYWRAVALGKAGDDSRVIEDLRQAIELNPSHIASYEYLDSILRRRRAWDTIVLTWTRLIEAQPQNGLAYFYRAGGYLGKNDRAAALADERKACDLGYQDACKLLPRLQ